MIGEVDACFKRGTSWGSSSTCTPSVTNWADVEDSDDFPPQVSDNKFTMVTSDTFGGIAEYDSAGDGTGDRVYLRPCQEYPSPNMSTGVHAVQHYEDKKEPAWESCQAPRGDMHATRTLQQTHSPHMSLTGTSELPCMRTNESSMHVDMKKPTITADEWSCNKMSLSHCLEKVQEQDSRCVMIVRKVNKLGFKSGTILKRHYSQYGRVIQAFVPQPFKTNDKKCRPGNMALVVMGTVEAAEAIFAEGIVQIVSNVDVHVHRFDPKLNDEEAENDEEERYHHCVHSNSKLARRLANNVSSIHADIKQPTDTAEGGFWNNVSLSHCLEKVQKRDSRCVMIVRKVNKLGFKSGTILKRHYSQYGSGVQAFVPHLFKTNEKKYRPGNMALVVMGTVEAAETIFAQGIVQIVSNVEVHVHRFKPKQNDEKAEDDKEERHHHCVPSEFKLSRCANIYFQHSSP